MNRRNSTLSEENFMQYLKNIFDIIDSDHEGFIRLDELARHLESGTNKSSENRPRMIRSKTEIQNSKIISALNQVSPASGLLNFQRFSLAMRIALGKASADHCRGIGRSLRPRSFLFAVTESSESESEFSGSGDYQENNNVVQNASCSNLDGRIRQLETGNQIESKLKSNNNDENSPSEKGNISATEKTNLECLLESTTEQLTVLKKSLHEVDNLQKWHHINISTLEERRKRLENLVSLSDEMVESDRSNDVFDNDIGRFDLSQLNSNISQLMHLKENLTALVDKNKNASDIEREAFCVHEDKTSEMMHKVEKQTHQIEKLEAEKAALLKELFNARAKLNPPEQSKEAVLPF